MNVCTHFHTNTQICLYPTTNRQGHTNKHKHSIKGWMCTHIHTHIYTSTDRSTDRSKIYKRDTHNITSHMDLKSPAEKNAEHVSLIPPQASYESNLVKLYNGTLEPGTHVGWPRKEPRSFNLQQDFSGQHISEALKRKLQDEEDDRRHKAAAAQKHIDADKDACRDFCQACYRPLYRGRRCQTPHCPHYAGMFVGMGEW